MISEKQFSQQVFDLARLNGWLAFRYPTWQRTATTPGFPDLVLVRPGEILFLELKSEKGTISAAQESVLALLSGVTRVRVGTAKPSDWDTLVETLKRVPPACEALSEPVALQNAGGE